MVPKIGVQKIGVLEYWSPEDWGIGVMDYWSVGLEKKTFERSNFLLGSGFL
jgi:hypothetical protein